MSACILWPFAKDRDGYGYLKSGLNAARAHRLFYELLVGPIPKGMHILHSCDRRDCVNPAHLRPGTHVENLADMIVRGRHAKGTDFSNAKLTDEVVREIRVSHETVRALAARLGVGKTIVHDVRRGRVWKHVI